MRIKTADRCRGRSLGGGISGLTDGRIRTLQMQLGRLLGGGVADTAGDTVTELRRLTSPTIFWCQNLLKKWRRPAGQWDMDMRRFRGSEDWKVQNWISGPPVGPEWTRQQHD